MVAGVEQMVRALPSLSVSQLQRLATAAQAALDAREADALIEQRIPGAPPCVHCGHARCIRWGSANGLQRWRCAEPACRRTFTKATGTPLHGARKRTALALAAHDMLAENPRSCRRLARDLGVHRMTIWRWRVRLLEALRTHGERGLAGLVEADETFFRESRKGSREWARHARGIGPAPPRPRWRDHDRQGIPMPRGLSRWQIPVLVLRDRHGRTNASRLQALRYPHFEAVLDDVLAADAILCTDGAAVYRRYGRTRGRVVEQINTRLGIRVRDGVFHIQNANAYHSRFQAFMRPFRGPSTRYLPLYAGWMLFRDELRVGGFEGNPLVQRLLGS